MERRLCPRKTLLSKTTKSLWLGPRCFKSCNAESKFLLLKGAPVPIQPMIPHILLQNKRILVKVYLHYVELLDFIIGPVYVGIILFVGLRISSGFADSIDRRLFNLGLLAKLVSSFAIGIIYWFYYQDGDTVYYFERMLRVSKTLKNDLLLGLQLSLIHI